MSINVFIVSYLIISVFYGGMMMYGKWEQSSNLKEYIIFTFESLLAIFISLPICIAQYLYHFLIDLPSLLQIRFFYQFYFTDKLHNKDDDFMKRLNHIANNHFNTKSLRHRIYRYGVSLMNKRHNYKNNTK